MAWKIGQVVKRTGLTARALHFYEEQGLIGPIERNAAGHRIYQQRDLLRLQQIRSLRLLGVTLADMAPLLNDSDQVVPQLRQQLDQLRQQRDAIVAIEERVTRLISELEKSSIRSEALDELLFSTLESMTMYEKYFDQNEIDNMHNHGHSDDDNLSVEQAWDQWVAKMQSAFDAGADTQSAEVQQLMQHWNEMVDHLCGGDEKRLQAFNDLLHNEAQARKDHGLSDELFEYMGKAIGGH